MKKNNLSDKISIHIDETDPKCIYIWLGLENGYMSSVICGFIEPSENEYRAVISKVLGVHLNCQTEFRAKTLKGAKTWVLDTLADIFSDVSKQFKGLSI